jgi:hypothetical protein
MQTLPEVSPEGGIPSRGPCSRFRAPDETLRLIAGCVSDGRVCTRCTTYCPETQIAVHAGAAQAWFRGRVTIGYIHGLADEGRP